ncbi:hypothetical protein ACIA8M_36855 [Streptomyces anulatus]
MLDLISHFAVLDTLRVKLREQTASGTVSDDRVKDALEAVEDKYSYAALGSVIDHLLAHDGTSDEEIELLQDAKSVYADIELFVLDARKIRNRIEDFARQPSVSANDYNQVRWELAQLIRRWDPLVSRLQDYGWNRLQRPLAHLYQHPQAQDQPLSAWPWRDAVLSRRTGAFAAEVMQGCRQVGTPEALAFGVGALAGYAGNYLGSPYLVHGVGGPRRSHPYRDRLASFSVGSWLRHGLPGVQMDFPPIRHVPIFGPYANPRLPDWISTLLADSLHNTYAGSGLTPPDASAAYVRLVEHWRLINAFPALAPAPPVADDLEVRITTELTPQDIYRPPSPPGTSGPPGPAPSGSSGNIFDPGPGAPPWFMPAHEDAWDVVKEVCLDLLLGPVFLIRVGFWLGHGSGDSEPKPQPTNPPPIVSGVPQRLETPMTQSQVDTVMSQNDVLISVHLLSQLDRCLHRLATDCLRAMKIVGLLYPGEGDLNNPYFRQFVVLPQKDDLHWPLRSLLETDRYLKWPSSLIENPVTMPSDFSTGVKPISFLVDGFGGGPSVSSEGLNMLVAELAEDSSSPVRVENLNLDGDRGRQHECWALFGTSIFDDPLSPVALGYGDL